MTGEYAAANTVFLPLFWLFVKHFICDFPLQAYPWMYRNKGTYGHLGGVAHASIHAAGTAMVLAPFIGLAALKFALIDAIVHYHIDWAKMNVSLEIHVGAEPPFNGHAFRFSTSTRSSEPAASTAFTSSYLNPRISRK